MIGRQITPFELLRFPLDPLTGPVTDGAFPRLGSGLGPRPVADGAHRRMRDPHFLLAAGQDGGRGASTSRYEQILSAPVNTLTHINQTGDSTDIHVRRGRRVFGEFDTDQKRSAVCTL